MGGIAIEEEAGFDGERLLAWQATTGEPEPEVVPVTALVHELSSAIQRAVALAVLHLQV